MTGEFLRDFRSNRVVRAASALGLTLMLAACSNSDKPNPQEAELKDRAYNAYALPYNQMPGPVLYPVYDKIFNPITPICYEETPRAKVASILTEIYVKGLGSPAIGYVNSTEFPEIYGQSLPDCSDADRAKITIPMPKGT